MERAPAAWARMRNLLPGPLQERFVGSRCHRSSRLSRHDQTPPTGTWRLRAGPLPCSSLAELAVDTAAHVGIFGRLVDLLRSSKPKERSVGQLSSATSSAVRGPNGKTVSKVLQLDSGALETLDARLQRLPLLSSSTTPKARLSTRPVSRTHVSSSSTDVSKRE